MQNRVVFVRLVAASVVSARERYHECCVIISLWRHNSAQQGLQDQLDNADTGFMREGHAEQCGK
jgi:hypothetical protein